MPSNDYQQKQWCKFSTIIQTWFHVILGRLGYGGIVMAEFATDDSVEAGHQGGGRGMGVPLLHRLYITLYAGLCLLSTVKVKWSLENSNHYAFVSYRYKIKCILLLLGCFVRCKVSLTSYFILVPDLLFLSAWLSGTPCPALPIVLLFNYVSNYDVKWKAQRFRQHQMSWHTLGWDHRSNSLHILQTYFGPEVRQ